MRCPQFVGAMSGAHDVDSVLGTGAKKERADLVQSFNSLQQLYQAGCTGSKRLSQAPAGWAGAEGASRGRCGIPKDSCGVRSVNGRK